MNTNNNESDSEDADTLHPLPSEGSVTSSRELDRDEVADDSYHVDEGMMQNENDRSSENTGRITYDYNDQVERDDDEDDEELFRVESLLEQIQSVEVEDQISVLTELGDVLQRADDAYLSTTPNPFDEDRSRYPIGEMQALVQDDVDAMDTIQHIAFHTRSHDTSIPSQVQALRILWLSGAWSEEDTEVTETEIQFFDEILQIASLRQQHTYRRHHHHHYHQQQQQRRVYATLLLSHLLNHPDLDQRAVQDNTILDTMLRRLSQCITLIGVPPADPSASSSSSSSSSSLSSSPSHEDPSLALLEVSGLLQCLGRLGDFVEALPTALRYHMHRYGTALLSSYPAFSSFASPGNTVPYQRLIIGAFQTVIAFLAHKRFAAEFIEAGGMESVLRWWSVPAGGSPDGNRYGYAGGVALVLAGVGTQTSVLEQHLCLRRPSTLTAMVDTAISLMTHAAPLDIKKHIAFFFSYAFAFRPVLTSFDRCHALPRLLDLLRIAVTTSSSSHSSLSLIDTLSRRDLALRTTQSLLIYLRAHLCLSAWHRRSLSLSSSIPSSSSSSSRSAIVTASRRHKPLDLSPSSIDRYISLLTNTPSPHLGATEPSSALSSPPSSPPFRPRSRLPSPSQHQHQLHNNYTAAITTVLDAGGVDLVLEVLRMERRWRQPHVAVAALEVLKIMTTVVTVHGTLTETVMPTLLVNTIGEEGRREGTERVAGIGTILDAVAGRWSTDCEVIKCGLEVLVHCVCAHPSPYSRQVWDAVRSHDGIKIILSRLTFAQPHRWADRIRCLACQVLLGLCQDTTVSQILQQMPLSRIIANAVAEPVLATENNPDFRLFRRLAADLVARTQPHHTPGSVTSFSSGTVPDTLHHNAIVAHSDITFPQRDLLRVVSRYLRHQGMSRSAGILDREMAQHPSLRREVSRGTAADTQLEQMVASHLRTEHSYCPYPAALLPPFSLSTPHRCPPPPSHRPGSRASWIATSLTARRDAQVRGRVSPVAAAGYDRRFLFSRFRHFFTHQDEEGSVGSSAFTRDGETLLVGTDTGVVHMVDADTMEHRTSEEVSPHHGIYGIEISSRGAAALWLSDGVAVHPAAKHLSSDSCSLFIDDVDTAKFNHGGDRIVANGAHHTYLYDVETNQKIATLEDNGHTNEYVNNVACFSPDDDLILSDGTLWDVRQQKMVHKFDRLTNYGYGSFHPHGNEVIINSEVWDLHTLKLLRSCPHLDQARVKFSSTGDVIFAITRMSSPSAHESLSSYLRTIDSRSYNTIATVDMGRPVLDLSIHPMDSMVALVEPETAGGSCRVYEVGSTAAAADTESMTSTEDSEELMEYSDYSADLSEDWEDNNYNYDLAVDEDINGNEDEEYDYAFDFGEDNDDDDDAEEYDDDSYDMDIEEFSQ